MSMQASKPGRPLTGRAVLFMLLSFFGVIFAVNIVMMRYAVTTFSGQGERNAYMAGVTHNRALAAARAQDQLGWKVEARLDRPAPGLTAIVVTRGGEQGGARSLEVRARFEHPAVSRQDRAVALEPAGDNTWRGTLELPPGAWDVVIEMRAGGEMKFRSRQRVEVRDTKLRVDG